MDADHIVLVVAAFLASHAHVVQLLAGFLQTGRLRVFTYDAVLQVGHPVLNGCLCHGIKLVDTQQEILRKNLLRRHHQRCRTLNEVLLLGCKLQHRVGLGHALKACYTVVYIVFAAAQVEIEHADGVHLLDVLIVLANLQLFNHRLRCPIKDALHEVGLACQLHLNDDNLAVAGPCLHVHTVRLVFAGVAVALTL